jgi:hypothetical protein
MGDEAQGGAASGGAPAPVSAPITAESLGAIQGDSFRALLPNDFKEKGYLKDAKSFSDVFKKLDGAETLLGQRQFPDDKSTPEQWQAFHGKFRPATADKYEFPGVEGIPAEYVTKLSEAKELREILHSADQSPYQAKKLLSGFMKSLYTAEQNYIKTKDESFAKLSTELYGEQKDAIIANGKKFLTAHLPDNVKPLLEQMDEKQMTVLLAATDGLAKKFSGEDPFRGGSGEGGGSGAVSETSIIADMQTLMKDPAYGDPFKDQVKHGQLMQKMEGLRGKLRALRSGQK